MIKVDIIRATRSSGHIKLDNFDSLRARPQQLHQEQEIFSVLTAVKRSDQFFFLSQVYADFSHLQIAAFHCRYGEILCSCVQARRVP